MKRVKLQTQIRRDQIAEAVMAVAAAGGLEQLNVAAVARRVGVVPSALYRHYRSKDAMLETTLERLGERLMGNVRRAREGSADPLDATRLLLDLHVATFLDSGGVPFLFWSEAFTRQQRRRERLLQVLGRYRAAIAELVREAQRDGQVRSDLDPDMLALVFLGLFQPGAVLWRLSRGRFDLVAHTRQAWNVFRDGVRVPAAPRSRRRAPRRIAQEASA